MATEALNQTSFKYVYTNTAGEIVYTNGADDKSQKKAAELSQSDLKDSTKQSFKNNQGQTVELAKDKEGNVIGIYDGRGKAVKLSDEQMTAIAHTFNLKTQKEANKAGIVSWAERQQEWFNEGGMLGSMAGHVLLGPLKFFGNVFTGNFSDAFSMDTLKWLGSTGVVVGAGFGISSLLKDSSTSSSDITSAALSATTQTTGIGLDSIIPSSGDKTESNNATGNTTSTGSATKALEKAGTAKVSTEQEEQQLKAQLQAQRS